jgi:hypothetical protein
MGFCFCSPLFCYRRSLAFQSSLGLSNLRRDDGLSKAIANLLNGTPELLREFIAHLSKPDDETVTLYADGRAVEIPVV